MLVHYPILKSYVKPCIFPFTACDFKSFKQLQQSLLPSTGTGNAFHFFFIQFFKTKVLPWNDDNSYTNERKSLIKKETMSKTAKKICSKIKKIC